MADRSRTPWKIKRGIYEAAEWGEVEVSTNDTVTIDSLSGTAAAMYNAVFWRMDTGTEITNTHGEASPNRNRCTINHVGITNVKCIYMAYGVKA